MYSLGEFPQPEGERSFFKIITLPQDNSDLRQALTTKLEEYKNRLAPPRQDASKAVLGNRNGLDSLYKELLLETLLKQGEVNTDKVKARIVEIGSSLNETAFNNAVRVIEDYIITGRINLEGGTDLK